VLSAHTTDDGATIFQQACKLGLEGIVSKRLSAPYRSGRSKDWIKVKNPDSPAMIRAREVCLQVIRISRRRSRCHPAARWIGRLHPGMDDARTGCANQAVGRAVFST
jgi:ATP-dependent DNA ligase